MEVKSRPWVRRLGVYVGTQLQNKTGHYER